MNETSVLDATVSDESALWSQANQSYLLAQLARIRLMLEQHSQQAPAATTADWPEAMATPQMMHKQSAALDTLCHLFGLSPFERDILLLCTGMELEASFAPLCAEAQGNAQRDYPTFALALAALPAAHWSALTPAAPLRHWQLIQMEPGRSLTRSPLRIDERVLHYLTGIDQLDGQLTGLVQPLTSPALLAPSHAALAHQIAATWLTATQGGDLPVIQLCGPESESMQSIAAAACDQLQLSLYRMPLVVIPTTPAELEQLLRLWQREVALSNRVLLIDCAESERSDGLREATLARLVESGYRGPLLVASRERRGPWQRPTLTLDVNKPTSAEQRMLWQALLDNSLTEGAASLNGQVERLVGQFNLNLPVIVAATYGAQGRLASQENGQHPTTQDFGNALWELCRSQARPQLADLAQHIEALATWEDLVLPEREVTILREIAMHVRQRRRVYESWGFADKSKRGLGISALFAGASGTGKTLAAEVLAHELRLDLYRIDLSAVVSKYIGETEKNLRRVFDAAETGGAILLFDEADALFGKRSDVKDSHDRYANIEVSYLLQRMESYRGLAILTTNMKDALDSAFLRRIRFIVQFPFPDSEQRAAIWRCIFPANTPVNGLDMEKLAQLNVAGGNIRNIALHAAFLAADRGPADGAEAGVTPVGMAHLLAAARREYAKLERSLTEAEIRGWV
jgi:hypothetical protein